MLKYSLNNVLGSARSQPSAVGAVDLDLATTLVRLSQGQRRHASLDSLSRVGRLDGHLNLLCDVASQRIEVEGLAPQSR